MRVHVVDPSAYTPPYDDALCSALGRAGAQVSLYTSRFAYAELPSPAHYARRELFYRAALGAPGSRLRSASKLVEHVPDMLRYRHAARSAQVVHLQWLPVQQLDEHLLPHGRPLVLTAHDVLPREPRAGQLAAQRRLYGRMDAVVVHTHRGRERLLAEVGVDPSRVHVIPHGVLRPWGEPRATALGSPAKPELEPAPASEPAAKLPAELPRHDRGPVVLFFGLLRPYKGIDDLLGAWRSLERQLSEDAELWIVGMPRMDVTALRAAAGALRGVRLVSRFVSDGELEALMRRADLVVLPYREIEQSGVAFTALGAGTPLLLSDVGGFPELAQTGAARTFAAGEEGALGRALLELLEDPAGLRAMAASARQAASGLHSWESIAERTLALYRELLRENPQA